jgi:hypothetical protein
MYILCGCETWSVRLTEKGGMKDLGNRMLKEIRVFWYTCDKVIKMRINYTFIYIVTCTLKIHYRVQQMMGRRREDGGAWYTYKRNNMSLYNSDPRT